MGNGKFTTGTGLFGLSAIQQTQKSLVTGIRIDTDDLNPVTPDLEQWLLFCDVGSIMYIRRVNQINEVAYYEVTNRTIFNNGNEVKYFVNYIDSDDIPTGPGTFSNNTEYYIGYINTSANSPNNAARWISSGVPSGVGSTPTAGKFTITTSPPTPINQSGWPQGETIVISSENGLGSDMSTWLTSVRQNDVITIRQRGNPRNFANYRITSSSGFTIFPVPNTPPSYAAQIQHIVSDNKNAPNNFQGGTNQYAGFVVHPHPSSIEDDTDGTGGTVYPTFDLLYEYEIGYVRMGEEGPSGQLAYGTN